jgi:hypothetical protein
MRVNRYRDAGAFAKQVTPLLMRDETVNHLILGILSELSAGSPTAKEPLLCAVEIGRAGEGHFGTFSGSGGSPAD